METNEKKSFSESEEDVDRDNETIKEMAEKLEAAKLSEKKLAEEVAVITKRIKDLPNLRKDRRKALVVLACGILLGILLKNILHLAGWWLIAIATVNIISGIAFVLILIISSKIFYLVEMDKIIKEEKK